MKDIEDKNGYTFIEIKTTGDNPILDKIFYISLTKFGPDMRPRKSFSTYIDPELPVSERFERIHGISNEELAEFLPFKEHSETIYSFVKDNVLGTYAYDGKNVLEFIKEEFFAQGIRLKYLKKDFVVIKDLEEAMFQRDLESLYYKYTAKKLGENDIRVKAVGEIFKQQCKFLGQTTQEFDYSKFVKNKGMDLIDKYIYEAEGKVYLNFGKYQDKDVKNIPKSYIEWVLDGDFLLSVKDKIREYLKIDYGKNEHE